MLTRYQQIPDSGHPLTEDFAEQLYVRTPPHLWPEGMRRSGVWENEPVEVREAFRERARRWMAGDLSVGPWVSAPPPPAA